MLLHRFFTQNNDQFWLFWNWRIFLRHLYQRFFKKIVRIIVKILGYYPAQIYLTEFPDKIDNNFKSLYPVEEDIRNKPLKELAKIISYVIINDVSSVEIILGENEKSLISVKGGFSIDIYNISEERLKLFNTLIEQENLFLRKEGEAGKIDGFKAGAVGK